MTEMDTIVSLAKRRGFVFQSSEIYGGLASTYDYGPLGIELKRNIRESWWNHYISQREDVVGIDSAILWLLLCGKPQGTYKVFQTHLWNVILVTKDFG